MPEALDPALRERIRDALIATGGNKYRVAKELGVSRSTVRRIAGSMSFVDIRPADAAGPPGPARPDARSILLDRLRLNGGASLDDLAAATSLSGEDVLAELRAMHTDGFAVRSFGDRFSFVAIPEPASTAGRIIEYHSRPDGTYVFGACGDKHLGSKYARLDVLHRLYDRFADENVDRVFDAGNWIDGEARFNRNDLEVFGMERQCRYLAREHPRRPGLVTYAVAGDDHEGWYGQREGVDIGRFAERVFRDEGRTDWVDLGFMEAYVRLVDSRTGRSSILSVMHPGGGSAYATSYTVQKIVESYGGGEKPAVLLAGHYHKLEMINVRNVWAFQTGTTCDQTPFMRKKRLEAHVGGWIVRLKQDAESGAIVEATGTCLRYFNRAFYNDRYSHAGSPTVSPARLGF